LICTSVFVDAGGKIAAKEEIEENTIAENKTVARINFFMDEFFCTAKVKFFT
jgi:hypothetical protein